MKNNVKVSVLIPVYNVEKYLPQCLDSVINQTLRDIEIICVNDASTDGSLKILQEYACRDSRIRILEHKQNQKLFFTRKTAFSAATGQYVMNLDSDDWLVPDACQAAYEAIEEKKTDLLVFGMLWTASRMQTGTGLPDMANPGMLKFYFEHNGTDMVCDKIFTPVLLRKVYAYFENTHLNVREDAVLTFVSMMLAKNISCLDKILYCYRDRTGMSHPDTQEKMKSFIHGVAEADRELVRVSNILMENGELRESAENVRQVVAAKRKQSCHYVLNKIFFNTYFTLQQKAEFLSAYLSVFPKDDAIAALAEMQSMLFTQLQKTQSSLQKSNAELQKLSRSNPNSNPWGVCISV